MPNVVDTTTEDGEPVELYLFTQGTKSWRFTDGENRVFYLSQEFLTAPIERGEVVQTEDQFKGSLSLEFPRDNIFAQQFIARTPESPTIVTLFRGSYPNGPFEFYWKGRVSGASVDGSIVSIDCESIFTSLKRHGLTARYEKNCRHALYSRGCQVNQNDFLTRDSVQSVNSNGIQFTMSVPTSSFEDRYFVGGICQNAQGGKRMIVAHSGSSITITRPFDDAVNAGDELSLFPGCDHSTAACSNKFNNLINFGGFPEIPSKNPFGGSSIV